MAYRVDAPATRPDIKDRLASACGSAVVMAITFVLSAIATAFFAILVSFLSVLKPQGGDVFDGTARLVLFFDNFIVTTFCVFIGLAALAGFALGSQRMARWFGIFWRTETPTRGEYWIATFMVIALLGTMVVYALRKLGIA